MSDVKRFGKDDSGGAIQWILTIIIGAIIAGVAYIKLQNAPGAVGEGIQSASTNAQSVLNQVRPAP